MKGKKKLDESPILNQFLVKNYERIAYRKIVDQIVVVDLKEDTVNTLNRVAARIWELSEGKITVKEIIEKTQDEFDANKKEINKDCLDFISEMLDKRLMNLFTERRLT